ncbi:bem46 protein, variant [Stygiomarasmius scandens]|uniref:Bem46 protein, variant n=1 Tax=Marasmiellus scandens TaxID=2682957 RepID=A0ABR1J714_9AGAR
MAGIFGAFGRLVRHGQILCIYPAAFEDPEEKESNFSIPEGLNYEQVHITTSDRIKLECLLLHASEKRRRGGRRSKASSSRADTRATSPDSAKSTSSTHDLHHSSSRATVISFHGNGYHVWHHAYTGENFVQMGCDVFLVSYRGYGHSEGRPSEKGLRRDAQAALDYVLTHPDLSKKPIIIHGHSLGGAVAIDLVSRNPTRVSAPSFQSLSNLTFPDTRSNHREYVPIHTPCRQRLTCSTTSRSFHTSNLGISKADTRHPADNSYIDDSWEEG